MRTVLHPPTTLVGWLILWGSCLARTSLSFTMPSNFVGSPHTLITTNNPKDDYSYPGRSRSTQLFGIPKMFRWLTDQYPDIINRQLEEGLSPDLDVDAFYLDMNGIIHPCTHGNNEVEIVLLDETAMFKKIFLYVDRLYKMVQPNELLYLAVDGVAPRAKMNQQRSRRFRSAKEAEMMAAEVIARSNAPGSTRTANEDMLDLRFDSNCITPGTDFMLKLSIALTKWVEYKMDTDPFWRNGANVIVSGPDVPGEGEHKVMDHLRKNKQAYFKNLKSGDGEDSNGVNSDVEHEKVEKASLINDVDGRPVLWAPGWTHVLYGLDADLIMLGLVSHEPKFMLLREKMSVVMAGRGRNKYHKKKDMMEYTKNDFEVLELTSLRQLLAIQFRRFADDGCLKVDYDLSRIVDDFVFMCMMVGNDFLPHCPHLEIDGGAISIMMSSYVDLLPEWGDYLTKKEKIHPQRFEQFLYYLSVYEEEHFKRRGFEENEPGWKLPADEEQDDRDFYGVYFSGNATPEVAKPAARKGAPEPPKSDDPSIQPSGNRAFRRRHPTSRARSYRDFYYETKMGWPAADRDRTLFRRRAHARDYLEGLHWNLNYYHNGCRSWDWFFPHLYSPLCTDLVNLEEFYEDQIVDAGGFKTLNFDLGTPFPSLAQLLSVLPPQSARLLPRPLAKLMLEPSSPLTAFYPPDFTTDPNGKRQSWEAVVQIPFIESDILLHTVQSIVDADEAAEKPILTKAERLRNKPGKEHLFMAPRDGDRQPAYGATAKFSPKQAQRPAATRRVAPRNGGKAATRTPKS